MDSEILEPEFYIEPQIVEAERWVTWCNSIAKAKVCGLVTYQRPKICPRKGHMPTRKWEVSANANIHINLYPIIISRRKMAMPTKPYAPRSHSSSYGHFIGVKLNVWKHCSCEMSNVSSFEKCECECRMPNAETLQVHSGSKSFMIAVIMLFKDFYWNLSF